MTAIYKMFWAFLMGKIVQFQNMSPKKPFEQPLSDFFNDLFPKMSKNGIFLVTKYFEQHH